MLDSLGKKPDLSQRNTGIVLGKSTVGDYTKTIRRQYRFCLRQKIRILENTPAQGNRAGSQP